MSIRALPTINIRVHAETAELIRRVAEEKHIPIANALDLLLTDELELKSEKEKLKRELDEFAIKMGWK